MKSLATNKSELPCLSARGLVLPLLEERFLSAQTAIEAWLREQWRRTPPPFYASVDLRNAGFKMAPVDTNLFPAGFNNLKSDFIALAVQATQETLDRLAPGCRKILLVPEDHTRNQFYFDNLVALYDILLQAGFEVKIGSLSEEIPKTQEVVLASGRSFLLEKIDQRASSIRLEQFEPCLTILNNDLSSGMPEILKHNSQKILPVAELGWHRRLKSGHFREYEQVCRELCEVIQQDPWLISPLFAHCTGINFMQHQGEDCMIEESQRLLKQIQEKYDEYHIQERPYIVIKADTGTYGMGVMSIHDPSEIQRLNRKKRSNMMTSKGNRPIDQVIIQEGVYTFEVWNGAVAEPVVYLIGQYVIGGFYRVHTGRGVSDNLNSPGMYFKPLPFMKACNVPSLHSKQRDGYANRLYVYGVIARLAVLASAREQAALVPSHGR